MSQLKAGVRKSSGIGAKIRLWMIGFSLAGASLLGGHNAQAAPKHHVRHSGTHVALNHRHHFNHIEVASSRREIGESHYYSANRRHEYGYRIEGAAYHTHHVRYAMRFRHSVLQCVPYAREVSHIDLSGNAYLWWAEAAGRYDRGNVPEEGAVLNFRGIGRMPLGHVAVVTSVIDSRTILVTQANWVPGTITNDVTMQDVSPNNDWSAVQVEIGDSSTWGAAYPTYGFIYNRTVGSTIVAGNTQSNEVAEAPTAQSVSADAPDRNLQ
jgi:surface antigen